MALTERERPYETLIRHNLDGTIGAHHVRITEVLRDEEVVSASIGSAVPLSMVDDGVATMLSQVLGETAATALTENSRLGDQVVAAQQIAQANVAALTEAQATIIQLQAQLAELTKPTQTTVQARIAARRYQAQIAGTTLQGMQIDTSTDSQALITGAALAAVLDSSYVCRWKMADGTRVELDASMIIAVASAVRDHIQACYDREDELLTAVADGNFTDAMLDQGWAA